MDEWLVHEENLKNSLRFNFDHELPILFIVYEDRKDLNPYNIIKANSDLGYEKDFKKVLKKVDNYILRTKKSSMVVLTEGVLI